MTNVFPVDLTAILRELSRFPYENLSKALAWESAGRQVASVRESPDQLYSRALQSGMGGTCFSLTHYLKSRLEDAGYESRYLMADKWAEANVHCGLEFPWEGRSYLLDPGYLLFEPIPIPAPGLAYERWIPPFQVRLVHSATQASIHLESGLPGHVKRRFAFRSQPVEEAEFVKHWEASFTWPMMDYPVLTKTFEGRQYYLQKNNFYLRGSSGVQKRRLTKTEFLDEVPRLFGVERKLTQEALELFLRKGRNFFS